MLVHSLLMFVGLACSSKLIHFETKKLILSSKEKRLVSSSTLLILGQSTVRNGGKQTNEKESKGETLGLEK